MLQSIRERAQGWIAWVIVILISVPFALWGIQSYLGGGSAAIKASVNDREISQREFENDYHRFREQLRQQMGGSYRPDMLDEKILRKQLLESVIKSELIYQQAMELGLRTSDEILREMIRSTPAFQAGGSFNNAAYENAARRMGLSTDGLEFQLRQQLVSDQLTRAISASEIVTQAELDEVLRLKDQRRQMAYMLVSAENYLAATEVKAEDIDSYYQGNRSSFMSPERIKLEYLELDIKNLAKTIEVSEDELQGYYEQKKDEYLVPEQRRASHILITLNDAADEAAQAEARAAAEAALNRIKSGEEFAQVAKELSQDPGSAKQGGDLGFFGKGIMEPAFEKSVFSLDRGAVSGLVQTKFGYHIIKLTDIRPEHGKTYDQVRQELATAYRKEDAERTFYEYAEKLADLTYEDPDSLEPAADALGLKVTKSGWIGRDGGEGTLGNGRVITAAFSDDVLAQRHNSELLELAPEHVLVLRVVEHEEPQIKPLEQVRGEIELILKRRAAAKLAQQNGEEIIAALNQGGVLQQLANEHQAQLKPAVEVERNSKQAPAEIVQELFRMPRPQGGHMTYAATALANGDYAVIALQQVIDGSDKDLKEEEKVKVKASLGRMLGQSSFDHMVENMRDRSDVTVPEEKQE